MLASECMTKDVKVGTPSMSVVEAARLMKEGDFGFLPIGENDRLVGMVTDRDIAIRAVAEGKNPEQTTVKDIMSEKVLYCFEDEDIDDITQNLGDNQIRRLPVLNREKRLVGVLSLGDISKSNVNPRRFEDSVSQISQ